MRGYRIRPGTTECFERGPLQERGVVSDTWPEEGPADTHSDRNGEGNRETGRSATPWFKAPHKGQEAVLLPKQGQGAL